MSTEEKWAPVWVHRIDSEIHGYETERDKHRSMADEYDKKIGELREKRKTWTDVEASGG